MLLKFAAMLAAVQAVFGVLGVILSRGVAAGRRDDPLKAGAP
jgi:hypothetical protein